MRPPIKFKARTRGGLRPPYRASPSFQFSRAPKGSAQSAPAVGGLRPSLKFYRAPTAARFYNYARARVRACFLKEGAGGGRRYENYNLENLY